MKTDTTSQKYIIYGVIDPGTQELRYVGQSTNFKVRKTVYTMNYKNPGRRIETWVNSILAKGLKPEVEVIDEAKDLEELNYLEEFYIAYYKALGCRLVNHIAGGKNVIPDEETRRKISVKNGGKEFIDQNGKQYFSLRDAAMKNIILRSEILRVLKKRGKSMVFKGFTFMYLEEAEKIGIKVALEQMQKLVEKETRKRNRFILSSEGKLFKDSLECKAYYGMSTGQLSACCNKRTHTSSGISFQYIYSIHEIEEALINLKNRSTVYPINKKFEDHLGNTYYSIAEAANITGVKHYNIRRTLNGERRSSNCLNGYIFKYSV